MDSFRREFKACDSLEEGKQIKKKIQKYCYVVLSDWIIFIVRSVSQADIKLFFSKFQLFGYMYGSRR